MRLDMTLKSSGFIKAAAGGSVDGRYFVVQTYRQFGKGDMLKYSVRWLPDAKSAEKYLSSLGFSPLLFCDRHPLFREWYEN
jgi:hypothetical protein